MTAFSFQLYSAREFPPLEGTLKTVADAGYAQVEGYGPVYDDAAATRAAIDAVGLTMPTGHFSLDLLENNEEKVLDIARTLGMKAIYCPYIMPDDRPSDSAGWAAFAKRLEALYVRYSARGYDFGWHNHDFEFAALPDGKVPMEIILDNAPSISWEADIAWIVRGGADPLDWIKRYGSRITAVHVKDIAPEGENKDEDGWADVGHGTMDWKGIMAALKGTKASVFVMEHDKPNDCGRFAARSISTTKAW
ncbi:sugar phosphate isomerase/epimerase family protein [Roseibium litorale]|uniref:Sugar phosphate isomerase/epimerase n=1 Tax=Roseibium litorale TaxID=2803841 RepID=A0ABR9CPI7_9HYPH|nr:sugar phosphate isomerase/epimerase [Roseibium litorale]MBD8892756.1 sugar phosphate isomerase/epimerase [Roseibium litorale]